jgi:hypothetical protein
MYRVHRANFGYLLPQLLSALFYGTQHDENLAWDFPSVCCSRSPSAWACGSSDIVLDRNEVEIRSRAHERLKRTFSLIRFQTTGCLALRSRFLGSMVADRCLVFDASFFDCLITSVSFAFTRPVISHALGVGRRPWPDRLELGYAKVQEFKWESRQ